MLSHNNFGGSPFASSAQTLVQDLVALSNDNFALVTSKREFGSDPATTSLHIIDNNGVFLSTQVLFEGEVEYVLTPLPLSNGGFLASSFDGSTSSAIHFDNLGNQVGSPISLPLEAPSQFNSNGDAASITVNPDGDGDGIFLNLFSAN